MPPSNTSLDTSSEAAVTTTPYLDQFAELTSPVPDLAATLTTQAEQDANDDNVSFLRTPSSTPRSSRAANSLPLLSMTSRSTNAARAESAIRALEAAERRRRYTPTQLQELGESNSPSNQVIDYLPRYDWEDEPLDYDQVDSDVSGLVHPSAVHHEHQRESVSEARTGPSNDSRGLHSTNSRAMNNPRYESRYEYYSPPYMSESSARSLQSMRRNSQSARSRNRNQSYVVNRETSRLSQNTADGDHPRSRIQNDVTNREIDGESQSAGNGENSSSTRVTRANSINSLARQPFQSQQQRQRYLQEARYHHLSFHQQQQQQQLLRQLHQQRHQLTYHHYQTNQNQNRNQNQTQHQLQHQHHHDHDYDQQRVHERRFWAQIQAGHHQSRTTRLPAETQQQRHFRSSASPPSSTRSLDDAIKYLERLRFCESVQDSLSSAKAGGFEQDEISASADFILDTTDIEPPPESSWLKIGGVLSGSQHAMVGHNSPSNINYSRLPGVSNLLHQRLPSPAPSVPPGHVTAGHSAHMSDINTPTQINSEGDEKWPVKVTIHSIDYNSMSLAGTMEAFNVPDKSSPSCESGITTFLEGEIIDFNIHTLETKSFDANARVDGTYWRKLEPFKKLTDDEIVKALLSKKWLTEELSKKWILMRWKEKCFVTPSDARSSLTISGFYYVSLRRADGHVEGLYYDPSSTPYQHLSLMPEKRTFPAYQFQ